MKNTLRSFVLFFLFAAPACAQRTVVSGTVTDAQGIAYIGGSLTATLTLPVGASGGAILNGAQVQGVVGPVQLDATGSFVLLLPDNTLVKCANAAGQVVTCASQTQWAFAITESPGIAPPIGTGPQTCSATLTISGVSQSVSASLSSCPSLTRLATGTVGPGGGGGGGGTPSTQTGGNCLATAVAPGTVCAGPVPSSTGQNPTFETSFINSIASSPSITITGAPLVNTTTSALLYSMNDVGGAATGTPAGFSVIENSTSFQLYTETLTSTAQISPTITLGSTNHFANLIFVGGNINATPVHTAVSGAATCPAPVLGGGSDQCASIVAPAAVSSSNLLVIVADFNGTTLPGTATISDTLGNAYLKVGAGITALSGKSGEVWIVQNPIAGTPTILIDGHENTTVINGCCKMYELSGATAYYTGATGPLTVRYLTAQDLVGASIQIGLVNFAHTTLSSNATITGTASNVLTVTLPTPAAGCPCRADIRYGGWANFAGVTNEPDFDFWVSDGTNNMVPFVSGQSNASTGAVTTISASGYSPTTYANNTSVTFTLKGIVSSANAGTIQFVYTAAQPTGASGANSYLDVAFVPSK